ncbi:MAG: glycosyltransferase [Planctomycetota bacterium]|nr:glycosyltransferase [Planctomycetota bacterium]
MPELSPRTSRVHIVARKNGVGIDRDVAIMKDVINPLGKVDWRGHRAAESILTQLHTLLRPAHVDRSSDLYLLVERVPRLFGKLPGSVCLVPNQERFPRRHLCRLKHVDVVLCKTRHAEQIFAQFASRTAYIGFTSTDRQLSTVAPDYDRFFHLAGKSTLKGTTTLLDIWSRHPEWPELTIVQCKANATRTVPANVRLLTEYVADDILQAMQNRHGIHLCPSLSEGWGHYIVEAMSCGAVVVTTDGPPMNELVTPERGIVVPWSTSAPRHLGINWHVDAAALEMTVQQILTMPTVEKARLGAEARSWYEENDRAFRNRFFNVTRQLLNPDRHPQSISRVA